MRVARASDSPVLVALVESLLGEISERRGLSAQSNDRLRDTIRRFSEFAIKHGVAELDDVVAEHVRAFVHARASDGEEAAIATMHLRRSALRLLFRTARQLGVAHHDPTLDLGLPPRSSLPRRPLTDDEVAVCRSFSAQALPETRRPAAWALAEATARTSEISHILRSDLDLENGRVWLHGGSKTLARWGRLTDWGAQRLEERLQSLSADAPVVYQGNGSAESGQASSCAAIAQTLQRAGVAGEPDVGPSSVAAWAGARAFREGVPIDEVARMLGIRSLDRTARFIGWDWTKEH